MQIRHVVRQHVQISQQIHIIQVTHQVIVVSGLVIVRTIRMEIHVHHVV